MPLCQMSTKTQTKAPFTLRSTFGTVPLFWFLDSGPLLRICNWVGHLSQGTKNNVKRGPEKNRNFEKSKNRKIEKIEKSKNRNFADRNFLFDYFSIFHCPEREGKGIAEILRKEYWNKD